MSNNLKPPNRGFRNALEKSSVASRGLKILSILGVCLIMAGMCDIYHSGASCLINRWSCRVDGILTPAQSILGAIQGKKKKTLLGVGYSLTCNRPKCRETQHHRIPNCRHQLCYFNYSISHTTFRNFEDWELVCSNRDSLAHVQFDLWNIRNHHRPLSLSLRTREIAAANLFLL